MQKIREKCLTNKSHFYKTESTKYTTTNKFVKKRFLHLSINVQETKCRVIAIAVQGEYAG